VTFVDDVEVIDLDAPDDGKPAPPKRRNHLAAAIALLLMMAAVVAVVSTARKSTSEARANANARVLEAERMAFRAREALTRRTEPRPFATGDEYVAHLRGVRGGRITVLLADTNTSNPATVAVVTISGEPDNVAIGFDFGACNSGRGFVYSPSHPGSSDPEIVNFFPYVPGGDTVTLHVWEYTPRGPTATLLGGVRGPFASRTRVDGC